MRWIRKLIFALVFLIAVGTLVYSGYQIVSVLTERTISKNTNEVLIENAVSDVEEDETVIVRKEKAGNKTEEDVPETTQTEPPKETAPIQVNFSYLKGINEDVVGWIYCEDTPISYPILQSEDNNYYLYRLIDTKQNPSGSLFMDFRNQSDFTDWNSIVYGHNMHDGSMFACLEDYKNQSFYDEHPVMYLLTPEKEYKVELVAGITIMADARLYMIPAEEESREDQIEAWLSQSTFVSNVELQPEDRFLALSTCTYEYDNARYVVIGALRELEA